MTLSSLELCAGAGGQAIGLETAGYEHEGVVEIDRDCCNTLRLNRPQWNVLEEDMKKLKGKPFKGIDLLTAGLPCPPFSIAGKQLGEKDERNLFPAALRLIDEMNPRAVMIENVRGFLEAGFLDYREKLRDQLYKMGYLAAWRILNASDFGVPQLRPRVIIVALKREIWDRFDWPQVEPKNPPTVGETLYDLMASRGWPFADAWRDRADDIAPTIVGGSKKHGGPDLGPTRAKRAWKAMGVDGMGIADQPPGPEHSCGYLPKLTVPMVARLQGFPDEWENFWPQDRCIPADRERVPPAGGPSRRGKTEVSAHVAPHLSRHLLDKGGLGDNRTADSVIVPTHAKVTRHAGDSFHRATRASGLRSP